MKKIIKNKPINNLKIQRDDKGRFKEDKRYLWIIHSMFLLSLGAYLFSVWTRYNSWYCTNRATTGVEPYGFYTQCPVSATSYVRWAPTEPDKGITAYEIIRSLQKGQDETPAQRPIADKIRQAFGGGRLGEQAVKVAKCESSLDPEAKNRNSSATGLFQVTKVHKVSKPMLKDADVNIAVAHHIYKEQGWTPWNSSRNCWE